MDKVAILIEAARRTLITFCELINPSWETTWFHEHLADRLQRALERARAGEKVRIILSVPPRTGKSQLASIYFPAWALGNFPDTRFILSTYGMELSELNGRKTRDVIASDAYQAMFPNVTLREDQKAKAKWVVRDAVAHSQVGAREGSYTSVGIGSAVTGVGGDVIIIDDPHKDRAESESETISNGVWEYYRSTLYSRLEGAGAIIVIMQRWNDKDLVGRLLAEQQAKAAANEPHDEWEVIQFPAIAEEDEYIDGKLMRKAGEPLWPSKFPIATLENIKSVQGAYFFQSQYQQNPIGKDTQEFDPAEFQYFDLDDLKGRYMRYYTLVDPAISQKKEADNTVVLTLAKEVSGPNWYRVREDAGHFTPAQTVDLIFSHQSDYRSEVHVEMVQYQAALKYAIIEEQRRRQQYFTLKELKARGDKKTRIRGLVPLYRARVVWHLRSDTAYEHELLTFPNGRRDDRADAMAYALSVMDNTSTGTKQVRSKFKGYFAKRGL